MIRNASSLGFVLVLGLVAAACGDDGPFQSPTAPSSVSSAMSGDETEDASWTSDGTTMELGSDDTTVALESRNKVEIEGVIQSLSPAPPANTLVVRGKSVTTDGSTVIRQGHLTKAFADLEVGMQIHVKARRQEAQILATSVTIQNPDSNKPVEVEGVVAGLTGSCPSRTFTVGGQTILTNGATRYKKDSCASLADGDHVEVKGTQQADGVHATLVEIEHDDDVEVEVEGTISGLNGSCPSRTFTVGGRTVVTNGATKYQHGSCSTLANGVTVGVKGTMVSGQLAAKKVAVDEDDANSDDDSDDDDSDDDE